MKKISNNVFLGRLTQILNVAILVLFVLSIVFLLKFDKINVVKVTSEPSYLKAKDHLHAVEHPLKQNQAEVEYYAYKLDTLSKHQATVAKDKKAAKSLQEDIDRTKKTLSDKQEALAQTEQAIADEKAVLSQ
jgi:peptidoglycan hydrolase CwlO-like protein